MLEVNTVYNKDCMQGFKDIDSKSVQLILTDIPYETTNNRLTYNLRQIHKDKADEKGFDLELFLKECVRVCNGSIYIFCSTEQLSFIRGYLDAEGYTTRLCIWEKTNPSPVNGQYMWLSGVECCVFAQKSKRYGGTPVFNEHCKNTVWRYSSGSSKIHPTQKSLQLFQYLISVSSNEGDLVLDPCMGSGTTIEGCINLKRRYIGFELNKEYFDLAVNRINKC